MGTMSNPEIISTDDRRAIFKQAAFYLRDRGIGIKSTFDDVQRDPDARVRLVLAFSDVVNQRDKLTKYTPDEIRAHKFYTDDNAAWAHFRMGVGFMAQAMGNDRE